jgi:hypothetical protein
MTYGLTYSRIAILSLHDDVRLRVIMLLYSWWEARNKANAGEGMRPLGQIVHRSTMLTAEAGPRKEEVIKGPRPPETWTRPPENILEVNCDDAFFAETKTGCWGFVIRDHDGHAILGGVWFAGSCSGCRVHQSASLHCCFASGVEPWNGEENHT